MYLKKFLMTMAAALCMLPLSAINPQNSKMKELNVKKVSVANIPVESVPALLDEEKVAFQPVNTVNWAAFPYTPDVEFRIAHTEDAILLHFKVREASVRAVAGHDNGPVWEDACVEFFSVPAGDGVYYNMECNCADAAYRCGCRTWKPPACPAGSARQRCNAGLLWDVRLSTKE